MGLCTHSGEQPIAGPQPPPHRGVQSQRSTRPLCVGNAGLTGVWVGRALAHRQPLEDTRGPWSKCPVISCPCQSRQISMCHSLAFGTFLSTSLTSHTALASLRGPFTLWKQKLKSYSTFSKSHETWKTQPNPVLWGLLFYKPLIFAPVGPTWPLHETMFSWPQEESGVNSNWHFTKQDTGQAAAPTQRGSHYTLNLSLLACSSLFSAEPTQPPLMPGHSHFSWPGSFVFCGPLFFSSQPWLNRIIWCVL